MATATAKPKPCRSLKTSTADGLGSVRGFESGTLGPESSMTNTGEKISYGGNKKANVSAELLFPMPGIKDSRTVRLSLFADAGSVWDGKTYTDGDNDKYHTNNAAQNVYGLGTSHKSTSKKSCVLRQVRR